MSNLIHVKEIVGENAITLDDGQILYDLIFPRLKNGEKVELNFAEVRIFASPFMNAAIGQLLQDIEPETLNELLIVDRENITSVGLSVMRRVIENAKQYYTLDKESRQKVDAIVNADSEEL
jgi:hypothetical protein